MDISAQVGDVDHTILARFELRKVGATPTFRSTHFGGGYKNNHCLLWAGGTFNPSGKQSKILVLHPKANLSSGKIDGQPYSISTCIIKCKAQSCWMMGQTHSNQIMQSLWV